VDNVERVCSFANWPLFQVTKEKKKRKTFLVLAVKEYVQHRGLAPVILDLSTECR